MAVLAGTTSIPNTDPRHVSAGIAAAVFLFVFNSFFAVGWLGMTWLYPAEITVGSLFFCWNSILVCVMRQLLIQTLAAARYPSSSKRHCNYSKLDLQCKSLSHISPNPSSPPKPTNQELTV